ncbi:MAG: MATE family efflux transporter [Eubacterium sp.]|nr:MATE family efflux transporter [Candidatus Colimonas fimequi]
MADMTTDLNQSANRQFYKKLTMIALPIAVQELISCSLSLVDNLMVGSLGEAELAAVGAGFQLLLLHYLVMYGFTSGTATYISQLWGAKDIKRIKQTIGLSAKITIGVGGVFFIIANLFATPIMHLFSTDADVIRMGSEYMRICSPAMLITGVSQPFVIALRSTQQMKTPLIASMVAFSTNTFCNYLLIFGSFGLPCLGVRGAAIATIFSKTLELAIILTVVFPMKNIVGGRLSEFRGISRDLSGRVIRNSIPTTANESLWQLGHSMYLVAIGHISVTAYAAVQAGNTINSIFDMFSFSIGSATLIIIGEILGQNKIEEAKIYARKLLKVSFIVSVICGVLLIAVSGTIVDMFNFTPEGADACRKVLLVYGCTLWLNQFNATIIVGALRGGGDTFYAATRELACVWLIGVPVAFIGAMWLRLPVYYVVLLIKLEEVVKAVLVGRRFISNKWAKNVVTNIEE